MDNKATPAIETAEYKYTEGEVVPGVDAVSAGGGTVGGSEEAATATDKGKFSLSNVDWKRFVRPILIVIAIVVVYVGYSFFLSKKSESLEKRKIIMQESAAQVQEQQQVGPMSQPMTVQKPFVAPTTVGVDSDQLVQIQNALQQKVDVIVKQLTSGQESVSGLKDEISKTERDLADVNQKIDQLTTVTQQLVAELEKMKASKVVKKVAKLPVAYHIRAIVPGRVWLESADGRSVTLRVGDKLEGYGEVKAIAPRQGMVIMSNGSVIQYGVGDF